MESVPFEAGRCDSGREAPVSSIVGWYPQHLHEARQQGAVPGSGLRHDGLARFGHRGPGICVERGSLQEGAVYAVEFSHRPGRDLLNVAKTRTNIVPIIEDARHPLKYRILVPMVDTIFADVAQPDQARIVGLNAKYFLKDGGHCVISIKASCIDSTASAEAVFAAEVQKLREEKFKPLEQLTLEPYERDHAMVTGEYRPNA